MYICDNEWLEINDIPFSSHLDTKKIWFQYSIIHRILPLNDLLFKMKLIETNQCSFCNNSAETITHIFYDCLVVQNIWEKLKTWIEMKTESHLAFTKRNICLGYPERRNRVLNHIISTVKYSIYIARIKGDQPQLHLITQDLKNMYNIDKSILYTNCQQSKFMKFWSVCHNLFTD